jgi:hypothetical protein
MKTVINVRNLGKADKNFIRHYLRNPAHPQRKFNNHISKSAAKQNKNISSNFNASFESDSLPEINGTHSHNILTYGLFRWNTEILNIYSCSHFWRSMHCLQLRLRVTFAMLKSVFDKSWRKSCQMPQVFRLLTSTRLRPLFTMYASRGCYVKLRYKLPVCIWWMKIWISIKRTRYKQTGWFLLRQPIQLLVINSRWR